MQGHVRRHLNTNIPLSLSLSPEKKKKNWITSGTTSTRQKRNSQLGGNSQADQNAADLKEGASHQSLWRRESMKMDNSRRNASSARHFLVATILQSLPGRKYPAPKLTKRNALGFGPGRVDGVFFREAPSRSHPCRSIRSRRLFLIPRRGLRLPSLDSLTSSFT